MVYSEKCQTFIAHTNLLKPITQHTNNDKNTVYDNLKPLDLFASLSYFEMTIYYNYCIFTTQESNPACVENIVNTVLGTVNIFRGFGRLS